MKYKRLWFFMAASVLCFSACNKFDLKNVQGVHTEGEVLLPIAHGKYTIVDLMQRFEMDSLIDYDQSGNMSYNLLFEQMGLLKGSKLLKFKDLEINEHFEVPNPQPGVILPFPIDTVFHYTQTVQLESEHGSMRSASMKSGRFDFVLSSNFPDIRQIVISSTNIKDEEGNIFSFEYQPEIGQSSVDLSGMRFESTMENTLSFDYAVRVKMQELPMEDFVFDINLTGRQLALKDMSGYVNTYSIRNSLDTVFSVFPDNMSGMLELENILVTLSERNTFGLEAQFIIDSALIWGNGIEPFQLISPLPLVVTAVPSPIFIQIFQQYLNGTLNAHAGNAHVSSDLILNPNGLHQLVEVCDTSSVDMRILANVPFQFNIDEIHYIDTVNMRLSQIQSPEWIEKLTLELTFVSTIPFKLSGKFMMYDSEHGVVTYNLLDDATLIAPSYDGQPTTTQVTVEITDEAIIQNHIFDSDRIILDFVLDTESHDVVLNSNQFLEFSLKTRVGYNGNINLNND